MCLSFLKYVPAHTCILVKVQVVVPFIVSWIGIAGRSRHRSLTLSPLGDRNTFPKERLYILYISIILACLGLHRCRFHLVATLVYPKLVGSVGELCARVGVCT